MSATSSQARKAASDILARLPQQPGLLLVLSGPSGSGKDAIRALLQEWGLKAHFSVTATTRAPRPGERHGIDYLFLTEDDFSRMESKDELLEHALVYGRRYGVPRSQVLDPLSSGQDVVARVDVQGASTLRSLIPDALLVFIAPPSLEEEIRRLEARGTEDLSDLRLRSETAAGEMRAAEDFDHIVVNATGALEEAALRVLVLFEARKLAAGARS